MCGPGDAADHLRVDPEVPERLEQRPRDLLLAGGVGLGGLAGGAGQKARPGHAPLELGIVGDRRAIAALWRQVVRRRPACSGRRRWPPRPRPRRASSSASSSREPGQRPRPPGRARDRRAPRRASRERPARSCRARAAAAARSGTRDARRRRARPAAVAGRRATVARRSSVERRSARPVPATPEPVARIAPASVAPVTRISSGDEQEDREDARRRASRTGAR